MSAFSDNKLVCKTFELVTLATAFALFLALSFISVVNDMYAFVKPSESIEITVDESSHGGVAQLLGERGVVKNPHLFSLFARMKKKQSVIESFSGSITLNSNMSYREILYTFEKNIA